MSEDEAYDVLSTRSSSFEDKSMAVKTLGGTESSLATLVLKAIDTGTLYFDKKEGVLYTSTKNGSFISVKTNERYQGKERYLKKVAINNSIREDLALILSIRELINPNQSADARVDEAYNLIGKVTIDKTEPFVVLRDKSVGINEDLAEALDYVIAAADLDSKDAKVRNGAMRILEDFSSPVLIDRFEKIAQIQILQTVIMLKRELPH